MEYTSILDSIPPSALVYKSFTDRYYTKRYVTNVNGVKNNDLMLMFHSNRIALLCLAPSHFFFNNNEEYSVNFKPGVVNRLDNSVKGKGKKGGQKLLKQSLVCKIEYKKDGNSFNIPSCMNGALLEVNEQLVTRPELLREYPDAEGYIAVILSSIDNSELQKSNMLTSELYLNSLNSEDNK